MDSLIEVGVFSFKAFVILVSIIIVMVTFALLIAKNKISAKVKVTNLNEKFSDYSDLLNETVLDKKEQKALEKKKKKEEKEKKAKEKDKSSDDDKNKRLFVINFNGDIKASAVDQLREEVTSILTIADKDRDEVVINLESPGGMVHGYGLAASQLLRIKSKKIPLTVCVDKVAASGGYMMACTADKIISAPFAIVGSVGVIAQVPNFNKLLKKHDVDYQEITAGEFKRTISLFGEITEKGKEKFTEEINDTHLLFKEFVKLNRPILDIDKIATGEHWFGERALDHKLVDEILTSDEYLLSRKESHNIFEVKMKEKKTLSQKLSAAANTLLTKIYYGFTV